MTIQSNTRQLKKQRTKGLSKGFAQVDVPAYFFFAQIENSSLSPIQTADRIVVLHIFICMFYIEVGNIKVHQGELCSRTFLVVLQDRWI